LQKGVDVADGAELACAVAIVGGGPAGLMAAEGLSAAGVEVYLFDGMPSVGRKFLLAGLGGLNLTHAEPLPDFVARYGARAGACAGWLAQLSPQGVREWAAGLGVETFVGSSQRVFPRDMKAAPLLRAWLHRLRHPVSGVPVGFHMRHRWCGEVQAVPGGFLLDFDTPSGQRQVQARAVLLALGGGSWARLGSDGAWLPWLAQHGVELAPLRPANCGFEVAVAGRPGWSPWLQQRFAGTPLKGVVLSVPAPGGVGAPRFERKGECVLTATGLEGSLVYAAAALLRDTIGQQGAVEIRLDFKPDWTLARVQAELERPRAGQSLSNLLRRRLGLAPVHVALLHEVLPHEGLQDPLRLAQAVKALPLTLVAPRPIDEAISTAGGVRLEALDEGLMLKAWPGVFCAGEMLDWEAPTGGYLLTACLASGRVAGQGVLRYLNAQASPGQPLLIRAWAGRAGVWCRLSPASSGWRCHRRRPCSRSGCVPPAGVPVGCRPDRGAGRPVP